MLHKEQKKQFQLERMILFSDAVFAIAITLLVMDLKVPHIQGPITDASIAISLKPLIPVFFGFVLSFFIVGIYWTVHHRIFGFLVDYDTKLIWLNLLFLLSIVMMPFSSGLYGGFYQPTVLLPNILYAINICFTGLCNALLIKHISDPEKKLSSGFEDRDQIRVAYARNFMMPVLFLFGLLISFFTLPWIGRMAPMLTPLFLYLINKYFQRKTVNSSLQHEVANT